MAETTLESTTQTEEPLALSKVDPMLNRLLDIMPEVIPHLPRCRFSPMPLLEETIRKYVTGCLSYADMELLKLLLKKQEMRSMVALQAKLENYLEFKQFADGKQFCKKTWDEVSISNIRQRTRSLARDEARFERESDTERSTTESTSTCVLCSRTELSLEKAQRELQSIKNELNEALEREAVLQERYRTSEVAAANAARLEYSATDKLSEAQASLNAIGRTLAAETHALERERSEVNRLRHELEVCKNRAITLRDELASQLKAAKDSEKTAIAAKEALGREIEQLKVKLQETVTERNQWKLRVLEGRNAALSGKYGYEKSYATPSSSSQLPCPTDEQYLPPITPRATLGRSRMLTVQLDTYQQTRRQLASQNVLESLDQLLNHFKDKCKDTMRVTGATEEIAKFRIEYGRYMAFLEYNIKTMIENPSMNLDFLLQMPEPPNWNALTFVSEYERAVKQPIASLVQTMASPTEPTETECSICFEEIEPHQRVSQCYNCDCRLHYSCVAPYHDKKGVCPLCQTTMRTI